MIEWNVLVTARPLFTLGVKARDTLESAGCSLIRPDLPGPYTEETLIPLLRDCDAVVASTDPYTERVFRACPRLRLVSRYGVGFDTVDLAAATRAGVIVTNTPGAMTEAVADHAFALLLALARHVAENDARIRTGGWAGPPGASLTGKTLGLVGFGQIGRAVARRAFGFGMRVLACDPAYPPPTLVACEGMGEAACVDLKTVLAESDFMSLHAPATPETEGLLDAARLACMKPTACLINTARGSLVDETALLAALVEERLAGAALDVFRCEPLPPEHPLRGAPRCLLSPHCASNTPEAMGEMGRVAAENLLALMRGQRPPYVCNPAVWDSPALRQAGRAELSRHG